MSLMYSGATGARPAPCLPLQGEGNAAVITAAPLLTGTASADSIQLAQDVRVGPPGVRVEEHRGPAVIEEIGVRASSSRKRKAPAAGDEPATLLFDFMHPFGAALAALGRLRKGWWDETGRQWTWEVHVVLSRALHERAPALVIVMDAHANPLRVRGVNGDENESAHDHQHQDRYLNP
jgi:hypothetical protein